MMRIVGLAVAIVAVLGGCSGGGGGGDGGGGTSTGGATVPTCNHPDDGHCQTAAGTAEALNAGGWTKAYCETDGGVYGTGGCSATNRIGRCMWQFDTGIMVTDHWYPPNTADIVKLVCESFLEGTWEAN